MQGPATTEIDKRELHDRSELTCSRPPPLPDAVAAELWPRRGLRDRAAGAGWGLGCSAKPDASEQPTRGTVPGVEYEPPTARLERRSKGEEELKR